VLAKSARAASLIGTMRDAETTRKRGVAVDGDPRVRGANWSPRWCHPCPGVSLPTAGRPALGSVEPPASSLKHPEPLPYVPCTRNRLGSRIRRPGERRRPERATRAEGPLLSLPLTRHWLPSRIGCKSFKIKDRGASYPSMKWGAFWARNLTVFGASPRIDHRSHDDV
jgi:hypothetical protein